MTNPPPRKRAIAPPPPPATPYGLPVIGGPRRPKGMSLKSTFPVGYFVYTDGKPINRWPWSAGSTCVGMYSREGSTCHMYRLLNGEWRYAGKALDKAEAQRRLVLMHERMDTTTPTVQPVAPPPRLRSVVSA